jgi:hypothetical protein
MLLQGAKDFMSSMGLGMIADQVADLKLGELLDTPPPGLDEAVAIAKVLRIAWHTYYHLTLPNQPIPITCQ